MIVVSPHLDDAVLGIGGMMLGARLPSWLVTVFSGAPLFYPPLMVRPHDERCGFEEHDDPMVVRIAEDLTVCERLNWQPVHLGLMDAQYTDRPTRDDAEAGELWERMDAVWGEAGRPPEVWGPAGVGHPDHLWVREQLAGWCIERSVRLNVWMEPGYRTAYPVESALARGALVGEHLVPLPWQEARKKFDLIGCYASQLNGITALAVCDALEAEEWATWSVTVAPG